VEQQAHEPLLRPREMAMLDEASVLAVVAKDRHYQNLFAQAFPDTPTPVSFTNLSAVLEAFQRRLMPPDVPSIDLLAVIAALFQSSSCVGLACLCERAVRPVTPGRCWVDRTCI
jgi:cytochrome c peroxidase